MPSKNNRYDAKRDANEKPIKKALQECGVIVMSLNGKDVPDLACYYPVTKRWTMLEVKVRLGKLTQGQASWDKTVGPGAVKIGRTIEQALDAVEVGRIKCVEIPRTDYLIYLDRDAGKYIIGGSDFRAGIRVANQTRETYAEALAAFDLMVAKAQNVRDFNESWED